MHYEYINVLISLKLICDTNCLKLCRISWRIILWKLDFSQDADKIQCSGIEKSNLWYLGQLKSMSFTTYLHSTRVSSFSFWLVGETVWKMSSDTKPTKWVLKSVGPCHTVICLSKNVQTSHSSCESFQDNIAWYLL